MTEETWRPIPGFEGYEVSDLGRVRSLPRTVPGRWGTQRVRGGVLRSHPGSNGYLTTMVGKGSPQMVHRLVMAAFVGPCPEGQQVRHLDGDRANPRLSNLAYGTPSQNNYDSVEHGTHWQTRKTHCPKGHPYDEDNTYFDASTPRSRRCKACNRERARVNYWARR